MLWSIWRVEGDRASTITDLDREEAQYFAGKMNKVAIAGAHYEAWPLGGSPFDRWPVGGSPFDRNG